MKRASRSVGWRLSLLGGGVLEVDAVAEGFQPAHESSLQSGAIVLVEMVRPEGSVGKSTAKDVVGGPKHGRGYGNDGFLRTAAALETEELGSFVAALRPRCCPSRLYQNRLEPRSAVPETRGAPFSRTFVGARAQTSP